MRAPRMVFAIAALALPGVLNVASTKPPVDPDQARYVLAPNAIRLISDVAPGTTTTTTSTPTTTTTVAPAPPVSRAAAEPPAPDLGARALAALRSAVPARWLAAVSPRVVIIPGVTSWSATDGRIKMSRYHAGGPWLRLRGVIGHEWGHQAAFRYGTHAYLGAPPAGWPYSGASPAETWSDCVAKALTGMNPRSTDRCEGGPLAWVVQWLGSGPAG